jgi:16S rRNA (uracil1498-N3)-methyltransferase
MTVYRYTYSKDMRLHRFYLQNADFETLQSGDSFICSHEEVVRQITLVLRAKIGDSLILFSNTSEGEFIITEILKKVLNLKLIKKIAKHTQSKRVILVQSLIKKDKFEWVAQKTTELGVTDIIPVLSDRSEKRGLDEKRLQKIIIEATEQSGWGRVPNLHPISSLEEVLRRLSTQNISLYTLDMEGGTTPDKANEDVALCVGPEGGWSAVDRELFKKYTVKSVSLGGSILRAETAAIVGVYTFAN